MVPTKITVDELKFRKTIYSKAAKNLRDVIATVKKARNSIGNDRMFAEARNSLGKLAENMERRAAVLEALAEALVYSTDTYKGAQTRAVTSISDYKAHKTDFYGKPVHVSGAAAGGAAAAAAGGAVSAGAHTVSGGSAPAAGSSAGTTSASTGSAGNVSSGSGSASTAPSDSVTTSAGSGSAHSASDSVAPAEDVKPAVVPAGRTEQTVSGSVAPEAAASAPATVDTTGAAATEAPAEQGSIENAGMSSAAMFGAGFAAAAAAGGAAAGAAKIKKNADRKKSVDYQIETAKAKLQAIEDEQKRIKASQAEEDNEEQE